MTTHNTHSEHGDVEESAVAHPPVAEIQELTSTDPLQDAVETPSGDEQQAEPFTRTHVVSTAVEEISSAPGGAAEGSSTPSPAQEITLAGAFETEEEVRPFTDFIEEFRHAEAHLSSALQAYQAETSATLAEGVEGEVVLPQTEASLALASAVEQETEPHGTHESLEHKKADSTQAGPPASPLLRPASRLRMPRHAGGRLREEPATDKVAQTPASDTETETKVEPVVTEPPRPARRYRFDRPAANGAATPTAPPATRLEDGKEAAARATARPENGYATNGQTATAKKGVQAQAQAKQGTISSGVSEQSARRETAAETGAAAPAVAPATPVTPENDRRKRHGQDRQRGKEQATQAAVTPASAHVIDETAPSVQVTAASPVEEAAGPEDLPPLEYSELQKASSRRRRRRHTNSPAVVPIPGASTLTGKTETPETPQVATPPVAIPPPHTPAANVAAPGQFAITSGFTVKQMSQGHDVSSPFMGPDPSPAPGSIAAQNVRSLRTDVQRTPAYPMRTTETTSASVHQLANIVSQAIQTQTERMVTELRRANQNPTNVSVSVPSFPSTERVGVFVDVANLLYSARTLRLTVDFGKLLDFLRGNRRLVRAHAYCPTSPQPGDEQMFLRAVKGLGYRITTKNYKTFSSGAKKADLDLDLCMDVVRLVDGRAVDSIVLVSGDSDFMPMLDYCSDHGVRVEVAAFDEAMSATLRQSCDLFINLGMLEDIRV